MSEQKHTLGLHKAIRDGNMYIVVDDKGFEIATLDTDCLSPEWLNSNQDKHWAQHKSESLNKRPLDEVRATATLYAAAPCMLDVLQKCKSCLEHYADIITKESQSNPKLRGMDGPLRLLLGDVNLVIARATAEGEVGNG